MGEIFEIMYLKGLICIMYKEPLFLLKTKPNSAIKNQEKSSNRHFSKKTHDQETYECLPNIANCQGNVNKTKNEISLNTLFGITKKKYIKKHINKRWQRCGEIGIFMYFCFGI